MIKLLLVAFAALVFVHLLHRVVRSMHASVSNAMLGKAVHVETPIGVFDLRPHERLDPELASMLVYPGATRTESQPPEYEAEAHFLGQDFHVLLAAYWTLTPADVVWEFYRRELPGWQESRQRGRGRSLMQRGEDGIRTIRVYGHNDSTLIETKISLSHKAGAAAAGSARSSDTRFGIVR